METEYAVKLPVFEGPLDLLLHLIKKNEIDIYDIPIALVTQQYLEHLELMRSLNLDIAGEFLVMAATLAYIKSRMLLPVAPADDEEEEDPRQKLIQQLLEYQKYKQATEKLQELFQLRQQVFTHQHPPAEDEDTSAPLLLPGTGVYSLLRAYQKALDNSPKEGYLQLLPRQGFSLEEEIAYILAKLKEHSRINLDSLFKNFSQRLELILIFLALLELTHRQLVRLYQSRPCGQTWISPAR